MRKPLSRRRVKINFMRDRRISLEEIVRCRLIGFIERVGYNRDTMEQTVTRKRPVIQMVIDDVSPHHLAAAMGLELPSRE